MMDMNKRKRTLSSIKVLAVIVSAIAILTGSQLIAVMLGDLSVRLGLPVAAGNVISGIIYSLLAIWAALLFVKKILQCSLEDYKISKPFFKPVWVITAFAMPAMVCIGLIWTKGHWDNTAMDTVDVWAVMTGGIIFFGLATGIVEELIFRGMIMSALEYRWNKRVAILAPSVLFGLLHIVGRQLNFISIVQLLVAGTIVGILFSLVTYESGSIWSSALIHGVWNSIMIGGILNIGEKAEENAIFNYVLENNSSLLTGGEFGVESSIVSILIYLVFIIVASALIKKRKRRETMVIPPDRYF